MNSEMQKRLYDMEVTPPVAVWEKLSVTIDEINTDNAISKKILNAEFTPPAGVWKKINSTINVVEEKKPEKKGIVINLRRLAVAAIFIGLVVTAWIIFQNKDQQAAGLTGTEDNPVNRNSINDTGSVKNNGNKNEVTNRPVDLPPSKEAIAAVDGTDRHAVKNNYDRKNRIRNLTRSTPIQYASLNAPLNKSFDQSIDDLSRVTSDQHYLTMVNANGRLVRIPAELAHLAPHLQDKPVSEDIYEVMFGEGTYWKETLTEWRKKVASVPVAPGDAFTSLVELLKTIQDK